MTDTLGGTIKKAREMQGMTQKELGDAIQRSRTFVADIEADRYKPGSLSLVRIATTLGVNHPMLYRLKNKSEAVETQSP